MRRRSIVIPRRPALGPLPSEHPEIPENISPRRRTNPLGAICVSWCVLSCAVLRSPRRPIPPTPPSPAPTTPSAPATTTPPSPPSSPPSPPPPNAPAIRKDLAYTYLKIGENDLARDQFREAMRLDPADTQVALEYAFLCYEAKEQAQARRIFDRIRKTGNATAEQAFQNIDAPLAAAIERWKNAIAMGADNFSAHFELATARRAARRACPRRRALTKRPGASCPTAAPSSSISAASGKRSTAPTTPPPPCSPPLAAASRAPPKWRASFSPTATPSSPNSATPSSSTPPTSSSAASSPTCFSAWTQQPEAEAEFRVLADTAPADLLAATQLGFLLYARGERAAAQPLFDRVLAGDDDDLANRVRAVLRMPQVLKPRPEPQPASIDAKVMAERSIKAGYMKDALKYLQIAHEADPGDFDVMLKLGWTLNSCARTARPSQWFNLARKSADPHIAAEAGRAWRQSPPRQRALPLQRLVLPHVFEPLERRLLLRPGPHRAPPRLAPSVPTSAPASSATPRSSPRQPLSEQSVILAIGATTDTWRGARAWFEAGTAIGYRELPHAPRLPRRPLLRAPPRTLRRHHARRALHLPLRSRTSSPTANPASACIDGPVQLYWNANLTADAQRQYWANFVETGPGIRMSLHAGVPT